MVRLYLDEDVNALLVSLLRARNIEVTSALERKMLGKNDREQLTFAASINFTLVTHNRVDFERLFRTYIEQRQSHSGIVVLIRRNVYEMAKRLSKFVMTHENIENQLWYV